MEKTDFEKPHVSRSQKIEPPEKLPLPRHKKGEKFLKGPIPWWFLSKAGRLKGHALHVAIGLWFIAGIEENGIIKVSQKVMREMGVNHTTANRGLQELEKAGLISIIDRGRGRTAKVRLSSRTESRLS